MTVWKNPANWRRKHLINRLMWGTLFGIIIPGLSLSFLLAWWNAFLAPLWGIKVIEIFELPILNLVFATLFFFGSPSLIIIAVMSFVLGVRIVLEI